MTGDISSLVQVQLYSALALAPLMAVAGWFVFSLMVFLLSHLFGGDGELTFKKARSIAAYAYLVTVPVTIVTSVLLMMNPDNSFTFSLHDIVSRVAPTENLYMTALLQMISLYKIWEMAVVAIGIKMNKEVSAGKAAAIVILIVILQYAVQIGSTAMSQSALAQMA